MNSRLLLLGAPAALVGERSIALACERRTQLLACLALRRNWVGRAELAALLWPEQSSKLAYTNLRKAVFRLQSFRWAAERLETEGSSLRLIADTDVEAFESALRENRANDAVEQWRGDLLEGFDDDANDVWTGWLRFERGRLRREWQGAIEQSLAATTDTAMGARLIERWLAADALDERAVGICMQWLADAGQRARAQQVFDEFAARVRSELDLQPCADLVALRDSLAQPKPAAAPAMVASRELFDDGFIGRAVEMRRVAALMAQADCRLLCITGPGGVGKTSLAEHALRQLQSNYGDGATVVLLDDLAAASEFGARLAQALDVPLKGKTPALEQVIAALRGREQLLVLDNFEHIADAATAVERLLAECAGLHVIVTSRVRLGLAMEWLLPLEGLPCPDEEDRDHIESFDAARLFVRAARRLNPAFSPAAEAAAIVDICRHVQGLPLALELAATWTRALSCDAIAAELSRGVELLSAGEEGASARHAGIDAVFDQSWRLLGVNEQAALARLSVFHGGFTAEAARAVTGAPLPVLGALIDKSLLSSEDRRLHLHPLVQQLAAARLDAGSAAQARSAHAGHFHHLLAQLAPSIRSADGATLRLVDQEFENVRRAWQWSAAGTQVGSLNQSVLALIDYCDFRGRFEQGLALLQLALKSPVVQADLSLHACLLSRAAHLEYRLDRYADAEASALHALAASKRSGDRATRAQALNVLGTCAFRLGRLDEARDSFERVLTEMPKDQPRWHASTLAHLALIEKGQDHFDEALRLNLQSLELYRAMNARADVALCLTNLGALYVVMKNDAAALVHLRESMALCEREGFVTTQTYALANLAEIATRARDWTMADENARRAAQLATATGNRAVLCWVKLMQARLGTRTGQVVAARVALGEAVQIATELRTPIMLFGALQIFAELLACQGDAQLARALLAYVQSHPLAAPPIRREALEEMSALPASSEADLPVPDIGLDELLHRITIETDLAHAPLIAQLRGRPLVTGQSASLSS